MKVFYEKYRRAIRSSTLRDGALHRVTSVTQVFPACAPWEKYYEDWVEFKSVTRNSAIEVTMKIAIGFAAAALACTIITSTMPAAASPLFHNNATARISGQVIDARDGTPLAGVDVLAVPMGSKIVAADAVADKSGHFTLRGLSGGQYRLVFDRAGFGQAYADGISVRPDDHLVLISPFAVQAVPVAMIQEIGMHPHCGTLVQPLETSDIYTVCSGQ